MRRRAPRAALLLLVLCALTAAGGPAARAAGAPKLDRDRRELAERLYARLEADRAAGRHRAVLEAAFELTDHYAGFRAGDRVLLYAVEAARDLGDLPLARHLASEFRARHPRSPDLAALTAVTAGLESAADPAASPPAPPPPAASPPAAPVARPAPAGDFAASLPPPAPPDVAATVAAAVDPGLVGVLAPLAGTDAARGRAQQAGAELAALHASRGGWRPVRVTVADTRGDEAGGALAARELVVRSGVVALVGPVAGGTAAAAAVAQAWRVPLVAVAPESPRLAALGDGVVTTARRAGFEARLVARLGVSALGQTSFAALWPGPGGVEEELTRLADAVLAAGGSVVASAAYEPAVADWSASLRLLATARPGVICVLGDAADPRRLAAQADSLGLSCVLAGPTSWETLLGGAGPLPGRLLAPREEAIWPPEWVAAFDRDWPAAADAPGELRGAGLRAYAAVRLVALALSDCGTTPTREELARALRARWRALAEAEVSAAAAARGARLYAGGRVVPLGVAPPDTGAVQPPRGR